MVEEHVDLEPSPPRDELAQVLNRLRLVEFSRHKKSSEDLARDDQLVDVIKNFGTVDSLSERAQGFLLLRWKRIE